jgi:hypothetical protein
MKNIFIYAYLSGHNHRSGSEKNSGFWNSKNSGVSGTPFSAARKNYEKSSGHAMDGRAGSAGKNFIHDRKSGF